MYQNGFVLIFDGYFSATRVCQTVSGHPNLYFTIACSDFKEICTVKYAAVKFVVIAVPIVESFKNTLLHG